jgi:hypothetical protein
VTAFLAVVAVVSLMGSLGTLIQLFADLGQRPVGSRNPFPRASAAATLLLVSVLTGIPLYRDLARQRSIAPPSPATASIAVTATQPAFVEAPQPVGVDATQPAFAEATQPAATTPPPRTGTTVQSPLQPRTLTAEAAPRPQPPAQRGIIDHHGRNIPELLAVAQRVRPADVVTGEVREAVEQNPELQDLYTVRLTLQVSVTRRDEILAAFTVQSRGGGFQVEAARAQAIERLAQSFSDRLQDVP